MNFSTFFLSLVPYKGGLLQSRQVQNGRFSMSDTSSGSNMDDSNHNALSKVFIRLSPLIGGPTFLPVHAEIMLLESLDVGKLERTGEKSAALSPEKQLPCVLHRVDFIPLEPKDPSTLLKLSSFQDVEGLIRHRKFVGGDAKCLEEEEEITSVSTERIDSLLTSSVSIEKSSIVMQLGTTNICAKERVMDSIGTPTCISNIVDEKRGIKLNLLRNNCYSFAWDVLSCLDLN